MQSKEAFLLEIFRKIEKRKKSHLYRTLVPKKKQDIDFSSNDYLGLNHSGLLANFFFDVLKEFEDTAGSTGSRLVSGNREIFELVEQQFAEKTGYPASLYFSSGYVANLSVIDSLLSVRDVAFLDRNIHASIIDGVRLAKAKKVYYSHNDPDHLEKMLKKTKREKQSRWWIFTESVFSMDGDVPPIQEYIRLCKIYDCNLFLDEAHSAGIYGTEGKGLAFQENIQSQIAVTTFPAGKALGLAGCFVAGEKLLKEYLINFARGFVYSTAPPVFLLHVLHKTVAFVFSRECEDLRQRVRELAQYTRRKLKENGLSFLQSETQIIPVIIPDEEKLLKVVDALRRRNFDVVAIRPPTVPNRQSRIRINIHAHNTREQIDSLVEQIVKLREIYKF